MVDEGSMVGNSKMSPTENSTLRIDGERDQCFRMHTSRLERVGV